MTNELEPCPFCGGEVERYNYMPGYVGGHGFLCKECDAQFLTGSDDDKATELFNNRYKRTCRMDNVGGYLRDRCSECGESFRVYIEVVPGSAMPSHPKFCPNCGAEVVE